MVRGLFQHTKNLLVEGMSEYLYLHVLKLLCRASGRSSFPENIYITPCGGVSMIVKIAALFLGQDVRPVVLLDGGRAATVQRNNLMRNLYAGHDQQIIMLDMVLAVPNCEIEDLIGEDIVVPALNSMLSTPIVITAADRAKSTVVNCIETAAARLGIKLPEGWKPETARLIAIDWSLKKPDDLPAVVLDRAARLFGEIDSRF
jgi:hypothetical protein